MLRSGTVFASLIVFCAGPAAAQAPPLAVRALESIVVVPAPRFGMAEPALTRFEAPADAVRRRAALAFPVEWIGGSAGSLLGLGAGLLIASPSRCNNEDLACILERLGVVGLISLGTAPLGAVIAGNLADARPSVPGAVIGSIAGVVAGVGLVKLLDEVDDDPAPILYSLVAYGGSHGLLTAIGSRIGALLRGG